MMIHPYLLGAVALAIGIGVTVDSLKKWRKLPGLGVSFILLGLLMFFPLLMR